MEENMKGISIRSKDYIKDIKKDTELVSLHFRPDVMTMMKIIQKGKNLKHVLLSKSYLYTLGRSTMRLAKENGITITRMETAKCEQTQNRNKTVEIEYNIGD